MPAEVVISIGNHYLCALQFSILTPKQPTKFQQLELLVTLLQQCQAGDQDGSALEQLGTAATLYVNSCVRPAIRRRASQWKLAAEDVDDICQETVLGFLLSARAGRIRTDVAGRLPSDVVGSYVFRIMANQFQLALRDSQMAPPDRTRALDDLRASLALTLTEVSPDGDTPQLELRLRGAWRQLFCAYQLVPQQGVTARFCRKQFISKVLQWTASTEGGALGQFSPLEFEAWLSECAKQTGAVLQQRVPRARLRLDGMQPQPSGDLRCLFAELAAPRVSGLEQIVWDALCSLRHEVPARDILISYIMLQRDRPGQLNRLLGTSINTPRNIVNRILPKLREVLGKDVLTRYEAD